MEVKVIIRRVTEKEGKRRKEREVRKEVQKDVEEIIMSPTAQRKRVLTAWTNYVHR